MSARHSDQDVTALYCRIRDALVRDQLSWWNRWSDLWRPMAAIRRREALVAGIYAAWQAERPAPVDLQAIRPLHPGATNMALAMVKAQRRGEHYAPARQVVVREQ